MASKILPTSDELNILFRYDEATGFLFWRNKPKRSHIDISIPINSLDAGGYVRVKYERRCLKVHRVIWCMVKGYWSQYEIDHRNGNPSDNRLSNLREATRRQNAVNCGIDDTNSSGYKGVYRTTHPIGKHWRAMIRIPGRKLHLGNFATPEQAHAAYLAAAAKFHGEFASGNHAGRI